MKYALLIYTKPGAWDELSETEQRAAYEEYMSIGRDPAIVGSEQLQSTDNATTVRVADGQTLITDGPFADTKEVFGGFYVLEADTLDAALAVAARIPAARMGGSVEIRPIVDM